MARRFLNFRGAAVRRSLIVTYGLVLALLCGLVGSAAGATYGYDPLGRLVSVIDDSGKQTLYVYDPAGNRTTVSTTATVTKVVPSAVDDSYTYNYGSGTFVFNPRLNDSDPSGLTIVGVSPPQFGAVTFTGTSVTYIAPTSHVAANDGFAYTVQNAAGMTASAVIRINLVNLPPVANPDAVTTPFQTPITFDPRVNDTDPGGLPISITAVGTPSHGTATFTATPVTYTPAANYSGTDSFGYSIVDTAGGTASSTITVTVQAGALTANVSQTTWSADKTGSDPPILDPNITVSVSGGSGTGYTYLWEKVSGDANTTVSSATNSSVFWNRSFVGFNTWVSVWRCKVTDSLGNITYTPNVTVTFSHEP